MQVTVTSLRLFLRSSTGPNRPFQPQSLGRVRDPVRIAEGPTAMDAATQRRHFGFRLRLVYKSQPIGGAWQRPRREDGKRRVFALHTAQTRPTPRFRSLHEVCTQGVPLHVANDLVEVVFCFHRETLVTPLIEMVVPNPVTMLLPPFHMRVGHLLHERGKIAISLAPNDKMPMIGHQTVSAQPHPARSPRFLNDPLERQKVLVLGEKHSPAHASVEHVENHPPRKMSPRRDMQGFLPRYPSFVNLVAVTFTFHLSLALEPIHCVSPGGWCAANTLHSGRTDCPCLSRLDAGLRDVIRAWDNLPMEIREAAGAYLFRFSGLVIEGGLHDDSLVRELAERGGGAITERVNRLQGPKVLVLVAQEQSCAAVALRFPSDAHLDVEDWRIFVAEDVCLAGQWPAGRAERRGACESPIVDPVVGICEIGPEP